MKKYRLFCYSIIPLLLFFPVSALAQVERKVAVFDPAGSVDNSLLEIVREEISSVVVNTPGFTVLERQLINKVLEENRFQESGLVNDEQMSDIGKRMGADYVFVTSISPLGRNYYISCKMIEVATARIERQSTGTTTNGLNDIPQTTQTIVKRLFVETERQQAEKRQRELVEKQQAEERRRELAERQQAEERQREQAEKLAQSAEIKKEEASPIVNEADNNLIKSDVVTDKEKYPDKVDLNKKTSSSKKSNALFITGGITIAAGIALTILLPKEYLEYKNITRIRGKQYNLVYTAAGFAAGGVCIGVGANIKKKESKRLDLVVSENGAGLRLTF